jgi:hypothetical protein
MAGMAAGHWWSLAILVLISWLGISGYMIHVDVVAERVVYAAFIPACAVASVMPAFIGSTLWRAKVSDEFSHV